MAKKYVPSGYQIINLDLLDKTSGTPFAPETDDEKLLYDILGTNIGQKPILLNIETSLVSLCGFGCLNGRSLSITYGAVGSSVTETFSLSGDEISWIESEE